MLDTAENEGSVMQSAHENTGEHKKAGEKKASPAGHGIRLRTMSVLFIVMAVVAAVALFVADFSVTRGYQKMKRASDRYIQAQNAASQLELGSDYLTEKVRSFVVTGECGYLQDYFEEAQETRRRDRAVEELEEQLEGEDPKALDRLNTALKLSNDLMNTEYLAMRLRLDSGNYEEKDYPEALKELELSPSYRKLSQEQLQKRAQDLVFDSNYESYKSHIRENVALCTQELIRTSGHDFERASSRMSVLVNLQTILTVTLLLIVFFIVLMITRTVRKPLSRMVEMMQIQETIPPDGAEELRFVSRTYNMILRENKLARERLSFEASHDPLTGLLNRGAYVMMMDTVDIDHIALIMVDVDRFKSINDTYGHVMGDRVLKRVAEILLASFRSVDLVCRIGGDEFVVVMTRASSSMRQIVVDKINRANEILSNPTDDLPPVTLSVGVAFSDRENPQGDIYKDADTALYRVKNNGRNGCRIF